MLTRLNEEWNGSEDASFYRELELEKKRWMLSAMYALDRPTKDDSVGETEKERAHNRRLLALYESQGRYIAALPLET